MLENAMCTTDELSHLWVRIKQAQTRVKANLDLIDSLKDEVKKIMGEKELVYSNDTDDAILMFTYFQNADYYRVDEKELREMAPLIWENHKKLVKGTRPLRVA